MSRLGELTRNCFQSGISPKKWLGLCKLLVAKEPAIVHDSSEVASKLSSSVLDLYRFYPGDPGLQDYLKFAIQDGMLSVATYVATLLQAARSTDLHTPATLDTLCRLALDAHYSSGLPPIGSVVSFSESPIVILGIVQDALALLRTAYSLPASHFHQLMTPASELVIVLLSCVSDMSQVSTAQAMIHFADANDILHNFSLTPDLRQVLETFVLSLSILIGDDAKAAREAQMMHTMQLSLVKGGSHSPSSDTDITTLSLMLQHMIHDRAHEFGAGSTSDAVAILLGAYLWSSWTPEVFYTQLILSAFTCLSQAVSAAFLWKAFIVGRLPHLLVSFERIVNKDTPGNVDWRGALKLALSAIFRRADIIVQCEHMLSPANAASSMDSDVSRPFSREVLQNLLRLELIDLSFAVQMDPMISNDTNVGLQAESQEIGLDLSSYLESKLTPDINFDDASIWMERIMLDVNCHNAFANVFLKRFSLVARTLDVESLSYLCKILYTLDRALDILAIHIKISDLIFHALSFLEEYDCETVGDPQTAVSHLGDVVLFVQFTLRRFQFHFKAFTHGRKSISSSYLGAAGIVIPVERLSAEEAPCFHAWFKALFDSSSEGIEDTILRSTKPKTLLRISATLFSQAIKAATLQKIDGDVLNNGISYFTGPLLSWTLVGVVVALIHELHQRGTATPTHLEILQTLLLSPSFPRPVLALCSPQILSLLAQKGKPASLDAVALRRVVLNAIGFKSTGPTKDSTGARSYRSQPRQLIQEAFSLARSQKVSRLNIEWCLQIMPATKFLHLLWSELLVSASQGEIEICRRIATFILVMPRSPQTPPLLPIFLHLVLPSLMASIDRQPASEQSVSIELLVSITSSALTAAFHLEWALDTVHNDPPTVLGQRSSVMARRLLNDLYSRKDSPASSIVAQRLASSSSFITNFPAVVGDSTV